MLLMPVNTLGALPHECFLPVLPGLEGIGPGYIFPGRWQPPLLLRDQKKEECYGII